MKEIKSRRTTYCDVWIKEIKNEYYVGRVSVDLENIYYIPSTFKIQSIYAIDEIGIYREVENTKKEKDIDHFSMHLRMIGKVSEAHIKIKNTKRDERYIHKIPQEDFKNFADGNLVIDKIRDIKELPSESFSIKTTECDIFGNIGIEVNEKAKNGYAISIDILNNTLGLDPEKDIVGHKETEFGIYLGFKKIVHQSEDFIVLVSFYKLKELKDMNSGRQFIKPGGYRIINSL